MDSSRQEKPPSRFKPSLIVLIAANLFPLYGAIFQGWSVLDILLVYWVENVAIGLLTVLKMLTVAMSAERLLGIVASIPPIAFFCFHYGMFTTVHGVLIYAIFGNGPFAKGAIRPEYWPYLYKPFLPGQPLFNSALSIFGSRLFSYLFNFIGKKEYAVAKVGILMFQPYGRIMILHAVILVGGWLAMMTGSSIAALALLVLIKTGIDVAFHNRAHAG